MLLTQFFKPVTRRLIAFWALLTRAAILGVRIVAFDGERRILLVRHTYLPGWYLPGGGVDPGEACADGLDLFGLYHNARFSPRNHVALYVGAAATITRAVSLPNREIAEIGWFPAEALPSDTTAATRRRIDEVLRALPPAPDW